MSTSTKAKMAIQMNTYTWFVMDAAKAVQLMELLKDAERMEQRYKDGETSVYIYPPETTHQSAIVDAKFIPDAQYALGKVAGKPPTE